MKPHPQYSNLLLFDLLDRENEIVATGMQPHRETPESQVGENKDFTTMPHTMCCLMIKRKLPRFETASHSVDYIAAFTGRLLSINNARLPRPNL